MLNNHIPASSPEGGQTISNNPWLTNPIGILAANNINVTHIRPLEGQRHNGERLVSLWLSHNSAPKSFVPIILGNKGHFHDEPFFLSDREVFDQNKLFWPGYLSLHEHMRRVRHLNTLPSVAPSLALSALNNHFSFFAAFALSANNAFNLTKIDGVEQDGLPSVSLSAQQRLPLPKTGPLSIHVSLDGSGSMTHSITGHPFKRKKLLVSFAQAEEIFAPFLDVARSCSKLIQSMKSQSITKDLPWLLPFFYLAQTEHINVDSIHSSTPCRWDAKAFHFDLRSNYTFSEIASKQGLSNRASLIVSDAGQFNMKLDNHVTFLEFPLDTGFTKFAPKALQLAHRLQRPAPRP